MVSKEEAKDLLKGHYGNLQKAISLSWEEYKEKYQEDEYKFEIRTRAGIIRDLIVDKIRQYFTNIPNTRIIEKSGLFILVINEILFLRFKKLKDDYTTSNISTSQSNAFAEQEELFPQYSDFTHLNVGYTVDRMWESIGMFISCPNGTTIKWILKLDNNAEYNDEITILTDEPDLEIDNKRIKLKNTEQIAKKLKENN